LFKKLNQKLNEKGQTLLAAMILSMVLIASYSGFQIYFNSLLKMQEQYREALNLMDAVDKASGDIRAAWDNAAIDLINKGNPSPIPVLIEADFINFLPTLDPSCSTACVGANCCPVNALLCYGNPTNSGSPYCFFNNGMPARGTPLASLDFRLVLPEKKIGPVEKYSVKAVEMVASLVHKFRKQGLIESKSFALATSIVPRTDTVAPFPTLGGATFITCGLTPPPASATTPACATIYACPSSYPQCSGYNGNPKTTTAIFIQQFSLTPAGGS